MPAAPVVVPTFPSLPSAGLCSVTLAPDAAYVIDVPVPAGGGWLTALRLRAAYANGNRAWVAQVESIKADGIPLNIGAHGIPLVMFHDRYVLGTPTLVKTTLQIAVKNLSPDVPVTVNGAINEPD